MEILVASAGEARLDGQALQLAALNERGCEGRCLVMVTASTRAGPAFGEGGGVTGYLAVPIGREVGCVERALGAGLAAGLRPHQASAFFPVGASSSR